MASNTASIEVKTLSLLVRATVGLRALTWHLPMPRAVYPYHEILRRLIVC